MSLLKTIREQRNLTQEELSEDSGISVRTIQRIESGMAPKGKTLKLLAKALNIEEHQLQEKTATEVVINDTLLKMINLSSLPFSVMPPLNIIAPLLIMYLKKEFNPLAKQIVSVQIVWLIAAAIIFMSVSLLKNALSLGNNAILIMMILLVISNIVIILKNSAEIDKKGQLYFKLGFSLV